MCRFFKKEKCNHHFPELNKKKGAAKIISLLFGGSKVNYWMIAVTVFLGSAFFVQTNITSVKGYEIKGLEEKVSKLTEENKKLDLVYIQRQSMANIVGSISKMDLVPVTDLDVINVNGAVALR